MKQPKVTDVKLKLNYEDKTELELSINVELLKSKLPSIMRNHSNNSMIRKAIDLILDNFEEYWSLRLGEDSQE